MWRVTRLARVAPWVPPPRADHRITMPPPPGGEVGGSFGVSSGYSDRLARTPYWERMAYSADVSFRMKENTTHYPMSVHHPGEYDLRYTAMPYPDAHHPSHRPLLEIGEARKIPYMHIPVICLVNIFDDAAKDWLGKKSETVYVPSALARDTLLPQRWAVYATEEAYRLLGLPVTHHVLFHSPVPKTREEYQKKILSRQHYEEERWQYDVEFLFRDYLSGKLPEEWAPAWRREEKTERRREEALGDEDEVGMDSVSDGTSVPREPSSTAPRLMVSEEDQLRWGPGGIEEQTWMAQVYHGTGVDGRGGDLAGIGSTSMGEDRRSVTIGKGGTRGGLRKVRKARKVKLF